MSNLWLAARVKIYLWLRGRLQFAWGFSPTGVSVAPLHGRRGTEGFHQEVLRKLIQSGNGS